MTKKAEKLLKSFNEKANNHVDFYFNHHAEIKTLTLKWTRDYLENMFDEFKNMVMGLYRFDTLSLKDMEELMDGVLDIYQPLEMRLYK